MEAQEKIDDFLIFSFVNKPAEQSFSRRNKEALKPVQKLLDAIDNTFKQINRMEGNVQIIIYILGRLCMHHFESILLLCSNEHGFSATRILRSMFEKSIDAHYLDSNPQEVDDFIDYYFVQLEKLGYIDIAKKMNPDYKNVIKKFKNGKRTRLSWSSKNFVQKAESVGADDFLINHAYRHPNYLIHSSLSEVMDNIRWEADGSITAKDQEENESEQAYADNTYILACDLAVQVLRLQIKVFNLRTDPLIEEFLKESAVGFEKANKSKKK